MSKQYAERDIMALDEAGDYYSRHISAMTGEALHEKGDIAAELAQRDYENDQLRADLTEAEGAVDDLMDGLDNKNGMELSIGEVKYSVRDKVGWLIVTISEERDQLRAGVELWTEHTVEQAKRADKAEAEVERRVLPQTHDLVMNERDNALKLLREAEASLAGVVEALGNFRFIAKYFEDNVEILKEYRLTGASFEDTTFITSLRNADKDAEQALKEIK